MDRKGKGTNAERELIHLLWQRGWFAVRVAGSGSSRYPSPDIVAANGLRRLCVECKTTSSGAVYIGKQQVEELRLFAAKFNAEAWIAFRSVKWFFLGLDELHDSGKHMFVSEELVRNKGLSLDEVAGQATLLLPLG